MESVVDGCPTRYCTILWVLFGHPSLQCNKLETLINQLDLAKCPAGQLWRGLLSHPAWSGLCLPGLTTLICCNGGAS